MSITDFLVTQDSLDNNTITLAPSLGNVKLVFSDGVTDIPADSFKNQTQVVAIGGYQRKQRCRNCPT